MSSSRHLALLANGIIQPQRRARFRSTKVSIAAERVVLVQTAPEIAIHDLLPGAVTEHEQRVTTKSEANNATEQRSVQRLYRVEPSISHFRQPLLVPLPTIESSLVWAG